MERLRIELVLAVRRLARSPGFSLAVILVLGLGLGAATTIFSAVNGVLLTELPYGEPERLVTLLRTTPRGQFDAFAPAELWDLRQGVESFGEVSGVGEIAVTLTGDGEPVRLEAASVSSNLFDTLGVPPLLGSGFERAGGTVADLHQAVISYSLWQGRFGGDPEVLGRSLRLDGESYRVVAVMPQGFEYPDGTRLWLPGEQDVPRLPHPVEEDLREIRHFSYYSAVARLKGTAHLETANGQLEALGALLREDFPEEYQETRFRAVPLREQLLGDNGLQLWILLGAVGLALLVACANVANLLVARALNQRRDRAIQLALGASRQRLLSHSLVESALLAAAAGVVGIALSFGGVAAFRRLAPPELPRLDALAVDGRVLLFGVAAALATGLLSGLLPAWEVSRGDLTAGLKSGGGADPGGRRRWRSALVTVEVAVALVLLIGAGLLLRSLYQLRTVDPGFEPEGAATLALEIPRTRYPEPELRNRFYRSLLERLREDPRVDQAGVGVGIPFSGAQIGLSFSRTPDEEADRERIASFVAASPGYFRALGIPLEAGRTFDEQDLDLPRKGLVISRALADHYFPEGNAVGQRLFVGALGEEDGSEILGIVGDVRQSQLDADPEPTIYGLFTEIPFPFMTLLLRSSLPPPELRELVKEKVWALDPDVPVAEVRPLAERILRTVAERRFLSAVLTTFAVLTLALAGVGLYGLMAYSVATRRREIGIRMALGAERSRVVGLVVGQGMALAGVGLVLGFLAALGSTRVLTSLLFEVRPWDPPTFGGLTVFLAAVAALASYLPARRAAEVDPNRALRTE